MHNLYRDLLPLAIFLVEDESYVDKSSEDWSRTIVVQQLHSLHIIKYFPSEEVLQSMVVCRGKVRRIWRVR